MPEHQFTARLSNRKRQATFSSAGADSDGTMLVAMKLRLLLALALMTCSRFASANAEQDIKAGLVEHTVVVRGYYVGAELRFDQAGHLVSPATQGFGPSDARFYITDVRFEPVRLTITGRRTFPTYDSKTQQFRIAFVQEQETRIEIALPADKPLEQAVSGLLKEVFLTTPELQETATCPAEEREQFQNLLTTFNQKQKHPKAKATDKPPNAEALSEVPQMCMPMGERAYLVRRGVQPPKAIDTPDPAYSDAARRKGLQGTVILFLVVDPQGRPATAYVSRSLGYGLDEAAVEAVRKWKFAPATFKGVAIPVVINVEINFRLT